jgi:hypothetical protein
MVEKPRRPSFEKEKYVGQLCISHHLFTCQNLEIHAVVLLLHVKKNYIQSMLVYVFTFTIQFAFVILISYVYSCGVSQVTESYLQNPLYFAEHFHSDSSK